MRTRNPIKQERYRGWQSHTDVVLIACTLIAWSQRVSNFPACYACCSTCSGGRMSKEGWNSINVSWMPAVTLKKRSGNELLHFPCMADHIGQEFMLSQHCTCCDGSVQECMGKLGDLIQREDSQMCWHRSVQEVPTSPMPQYTTVLKL